MNRKPPIAVSPRRLRPRRPPGSLPSFETPLLKTALKPPTPLHFRSSIAGETFFKHEHSFSDLMSVATKSKEDFPATANTDPFINTGPLFERGRFYDVYSARRNERLKRKMMEIAVESPLKYPPMASELSKKRNLKKVETPRKSLASNFSVSRASSLRSPAVKSSKGMKNAAVTSSLDFGKRMITRSAVKKMN